MGFGPLGVCSFHNCRCFSRVGRSVICTISPSSSMVLYQASCACVCAHACWGECQPGNGLSGVTYRAICVATTRPIFPFLNSGKETVALFRSGLSVSPFSRALMVATGRRRSRFHSIAFMARSKWASIMNMKKILVSMLFFYLVLFAIHPLFFRAVLPKPVRTKLRWGKYDTAGRTIRRQFYKHDGCLLPVPNAPRFGLPALIQAHLENVCVCLIRFLLLWICGPGPGKFWWHRAMK